MKKKTDFKPNYAVHPIEHLKDFALTQDIGAEMVADIEANGINSRNDYLLAALYRVPIKFLRNLQKNYDEAVKRLVGDNKKDLEKNQSSS